MHHRPTAAAGNVVGRILAVGVALAATAVTTSPAAASEEGAPVAVTARMTADAEALGPGQGVDIILELENRSATSQRVRLDEIVSGLLDDASIDRVASSSSVDIAVVRVSRDRLGLTGDIAPGAAVTISYRAILDDPATGGDGVLTRSIVAADDAAPACGGTSTPSALEGLGVCSVLVTPAAHAGAPETAGSVAARVVVNDAVANGTVASGATAVARRGLGTNRLGDVAAASEPLALQRLGGPAAGGAVVLLLGLLGAIPIVRRRRASARHRRESWPADFSAASSPATVRRRSTVAPVPLTTPTTAYASRRERRLAESRVAVPVA